MYFPNQRHDEGSLCETPSNFSPNFVPLIPPLNHPPPFQHRALTRTDPARSIDQAVSLLTLHATLLIYHHRRTLMCDSHPPSAPRDSTARGLLPRFGHRWTYPVPHPVLLLRSLVRLPVYICVQYLTSSPVFFEYSLARLNIPFRETFIRGSGYTTSPVYPQPRAWFLLSLTNSLLPCRSTSLDNAFLRPF